MCLIEVVSSLSLRTRFFCLILNHLCSHQEINGAVNQTVLLFLFGFGFYLFSNRKPTTKSTESFFAGTVKVNLLNPSKGRRKTFNYKRFSYDEIVFTIFSEGRVGF